MTNTAEDRLNPSSYKTIEVHGHNLNVFDEGDPSQPTLLLLHGSPHSSAEFRYNIPALREAGFRVVAPDHLGAGGSDRPEDASLYAGAKDYERTLALMDTLGIERFYVEGGDRGSIPLWMLAAFHPDRVLGMISENVSHLNGFFTAGIDQKRRSWYMYFFLFEAAKDALRADDWALARAFFGYHPDMDHFIADWERPNGLEGNWLNWYTATVHPDNAPQMDPLPDVTVPVLLLYSMNDPYIGPEQLSTGREFIKGPYTAKRIDGAGHFVARNAPKAFNAAAISFLNDLEARRERFGAA